MRRSTYLAIATGFMFALPAQAQTTGKTTVTFPPGTSDGANVGTTATTEAGPPQLKKPTAVAPATTTTTTKSTTTTQPK